MQQTITVHRDYILEDNMKLKTAMCKLRACGKKGVQGTNDPQNTVTFQLRNKHETISLCIYQEGFMMQSPKAQ